MKKLWYLLIITMMLNSCKNSNGEEDSPIGGDYIALDVKIVIVDEALNDRLNPDSPAYFGDDYTNGIKVLHYYKGEKLTFEEYEYAMLKEGTISGINDNPARYVWPPLCRPPLCSEGLMSDRYFYIVCANESLEAYETGFSCTYISYPDGSEDEIKARIYSNKGLTVFDRIWINGELAKESHEFLSLRPYYNPKYYPWMRKEMSSDGVEYLRPDGDAIVITK